MNQNYAKMKLSENSVSKINHLRNIANQNLQSHDEINRSLINNFAEQLIHGEPIDLKGFRNGNLALYSRFSYFVRNVIRIASDTHVEGPVFSETSEWVQLLIKNESVDINDSHYNSSIHRYIRSRLKVINRKEAERFLDFLKTAGYSFDQILLLIMYEAFPFTRIWQEEISESNLNSIGLIIRDRIIASRSKSFLKSVFGSKDAIVADLLNCNLSRSGLALAKLFYFIDPPLIDEHLNKLLVRNPNNGTEKRFSIHVAKYLLDINYKKYANQLIQKTDKIPFAADTHFELALTLAEGDSSTYHVHAMKMGDSIFDHMIQTLKNRDSVYIPRVRKKPATITQYIDQMYGQSTKRI